MKYGKVKSGIFLSRPNRFIAHVLVDGEDTVVHVKNTGRCRELLIPGTTVYLHEPENTSRKTRYDLIAVEKQRDGKLPLLINMDSQAPNAVVAEWLPECGLFSKSAVIRREVTVGNSRFDFMIDDHGKITYLEVKGCTLESDGIARFPDAPTERGVKHIEELIALRKQGFGAIALIVIQMKEISEFCPNDVTHPAFGDALRRAKNAGVNILAYDCTVTPDSLTVDSPVIVNL